MTQSTDPWDAVSRTLYSGELLSSQKWFATANEITAAMAKLEPAISAWWQSMQKWSQGGGMFLEHSFCGIYMMLAGFAIENLCKGNAVDGLTPQEQLERFELEEKVRKGELPPDSIAQACWKLTSSERERIKAEGKLPKELKRHKLIAFVTATGLHLETDERELLQRLKRALLWFGRYPVSTDYKNRDTFRLPDGKLLSTAYIAGADVERIKTFIQRLRHHVGAKESYRATDEGGVA